MLYFSVCVTHEFFCAFCNLIGGNQKSDPAQNPYSSYTRPFPSRSVAQLKGKGLSHQTTLSFTGGYFVPSMALLQKFMSMSRDNGCFGLG